MHDFTQEICQRCESDYATRKSPYCPRCHQLHEEANELTDRIMAHGHGLVVTDAGKSMVIED